MKQEYQDQIDKYVLGQMDNTEKMVFKQEATQNAELQEQLQFTKDVASATKSREEKLAKMDDWKDDYDWKVDRRVAASYRPTGSGYESCPMPTDNRTFAKPHSSHRNYLFWISGVAAIFIAGLFLFNTFSGSKEELLYSPSQVEYGAIRGGGDYSDIEQFLIKKDYKRALTQIELEERKIMEMQTLSDSVADIEQREYERKVLKIDLDHLCLFKIYALLGLHKHKEALVLLNKLKEEKGLFRELADSLYQIVK